MSANFQIRCATCGSNLHTTMYCDKVPMSTDTPRTDAEAFEWRGLQVVHMSEAPFVRADFARTLEHELLSEQAALVAKDAEIAVERERTATQEHFKDVAYKLMDYWKARAEKARDGTGLLKRCIQNAHDAIDASGILMPREKTHQCLIQRIKSIAARHDEAAAQLAAARLDTERLDWLENGGVSFDYDPGFPAVGFDGNYGPEPGQPPFWGAHINQKGLAMAATLRAAIDAARKGTK